MKILLLGIALLGLAACSNSTKPAEDFDPYALFYFRNDAPGSPVFEFYLTFPNRTPVESALLGSAGPDEVTCGGFGLPTVTPGDPANNVQLVVRWDATETWDGGAITSPIVDPFELGANTPETAHRFRLWLRADSTVFADFGRWDETDRWASPPGWPCPTRF